MPGAETVPGRMTDAMRAVRGQLPVAERGCYMNNAATSPVPDMVRAAVDAAMQRRAETGDAFFEDACARADDVRVTVAGHLGVDPHGIAFMKNTGEGINHVARSLRFPEGANVVTTSLEFPTNLLPWRKLAREGVELRIVEPDDGGMGCTPEAFAKVVDDDTALVSFSWVTFQTGYRHDVETIARLAKDHDALVLVDGIQGLGAVAPPRCDQVDFWANGGHKWLMAPFGIGFLYVRPALAAAMEPDHLGWWSLEDTEAYGPDNEVLASDARRFEIGNLAFPNIEGYGAAFDLMPPIREVEARILALTGRLMDGLADLGTLNTPREDAKRAGIVSLRTDDAEALHAALEKEGVHASLRGGGVRFSPHYWNTEDEVDQVVATAGRVLR